MKKRRTVGKVVLVVAAMLVGVWGMWLGSRQNDNLARLDNLEAESRVLRSDLVELGRKAHELEVLRRRAAKLDKLEAKVKVLESDFLELCRKAHELEDLLPSDAQWQGFSCDPEG